MVLVSCSLINFLAHIILQLNAALSDRIRYKVDAKI